MRPSRGVVQTGTLHSQTHTHSFPEAQGTLLYSQMSRRLRRCDSFLLGIRKVLTEVTVSCRDRAPPVRTPTPRCWCEAVRRDKENGGGGGGGYGCGGRTVNEGHPAAWHTARSPTHSTPQSATHAHTCTHESLQVLVAHAYSPTRCPSSMLSVGPTYICFSDGHALTPTQISTHLFIKIPSWT